MSAAWVNVYADWPLTPLSKHYPHQNRESAQRVSEAHVTVLGRESRTLYRIHIIPKR